VPKVVQTAGEMSTLTALVDAGVGVSLIPASAAKRMVSKVSICAIADRIPDSQIGMVIARNNNVAVVRKFCELVRTSLQP
jgi:DNA-binding transcriptional LysR family regulator